MYSIWTTTFCNLRCSYCYEGKEKKCIYMDKTIANQVIRYIKNDFKDNELLINFHGGEPFLNFEIIKYIVEQIEKEFPNNTIEFTATTNGTVMNEEIIEYISNHNFGITISIDGKKESHNFTRMYGNGKGSYEDVITAIEMLLEKNSSLRVRMTITPENVGELFENVIHIASLGLTTIVPAIDSYGVGWTEEAFETLRSQIRKLKEANKTDLTVSLLEPLSFCGKYCTGGYVSKHIYCNGEIYPCGVACGTDEFIIGDVYSGIDSKKLDYLYSYGDIDCKDCDGCDLKMYCEVTRCKILNKIKTGAFDKPTAVDCYYTNVIFEENGVI